MWASKQCPFGIEMMVGESFLVLKFFFFFFENFSSNWISVEIIFPRPTRFFGFFLEEISWNRFLFFFEKRDSSNSLIKNCFNDHITNNFSVKSVDSVEKRKVYFHLKNISWNQDSAQCGNAEIYFHSFLAKISWK